MYKLFNPNEIKPTGWLLTQLKIQAEGLSGNLDKMWPDIKSSSWIGGDKEGWERVPYWLDGFIPLAYLLCDEDMKSRAAYYINSILDRQQADGWICPCKKEERSTYDVWAFFLIGKVLALYCSFTESEKAETGLYNAMKCLYSELKNKKIKLYDWGEYRWFEALIPLEFLYEKYKEEWILKLARILKKQGADYASFTEEWKTPLNKWTFGTHIVNIAMMLKTEAEICSLLGGKPKNQPEKFWKILDKYNGTAVGTFTGDECLSGIGNNQGTELCSVTELMYSCERLYSLTGDSIWAQRLEKVAFNALPATISDDMWTHQYDQMVNQIACEKFPGKPFFRTNGSESHLFGLEPNFGCCTANFNQGWPKFAMNVFQKSDRGILCAYLVPSSLNTTVDGTKVEVTNISKYPFINACKITVKAEKAVGFELKIRIPSFAQKLKVNGKACENNGYIVMDKEWSGEETVTLSWDCEPRLVKRPYGLYALEYGALVFSLPIDAEYVMHEYEKNGVERKYPYCDYELKPKSEWNYGFSNQNFTVCQNGTGEIPFSSKNPPVTIKTGMCKVRWECADGYESVAAAKPVSNKKLGDETEKVLYPYGCAKLRMTEMPVIKK